MMSNETPADGLNPKLAELFESMFRSGQSEARGVADCLNCIAENGDGQESDEHMLACAEEMLASVQQVINLLKPPTKPTDDPYQALIDEATKAADQLDVLRSVGRYAAEANTVSLRMAITGLIEHLRNNVSNRGEALELHVFRNRKMDLVDLCYKNAAGGTAGELEFDEPTVVSHSDDASDHYERTKSSLMLVELARLYEGLDVPVMLRELAMQPTPFDGTDQTGEVVIHLANGYELRSGWIDKDDPDALPAGDYVSVVDVRGEQVFYGDSADLFADPVQARRSLFEILQACCGARVTSDPSKPHQTGLTPPP
jgi:hypothetical protein